MEPVGLFALKLLEVDEHTLWGPGWPPGRSSNACNFPLETWQKGHRNVNVSICSLASRPQSICFKKKLMCTYLNASIVIVRKMSLSFCDLLLTWCCCLKNRLNKNLHAHLCLTQVHTAYADTQGQCDSLPTTCILYDWQLKWLPLEIWILRLILGLSELSLWCLWVISLEIAMLI